MKTDVERYIAAEMTTEEANEFKNLLETDKKLAQEYSTTLSAHQFIKEAGRLEMKETLETFDKEMKPISETNKILPLWVKRALPIAAMLVIFFGVYQLMMLNTPISGNDAYTTYFEAYSNPSAVRSSESSVLNNWELAANYYRDKDFENAILYFEKPGDEVPTYLSSFYIGVSSLAKKEANYKKALENFEAVFTTDNDYHQQALWYKGLTLLELGSVKESKMIFKLIVDNKEFNYLKAEEILNLKIEN